MHSIGQSELRHPFSIYLTNCTELVYTCNDTVSKYFQKSKIEPTLFLKRGAAFHDGRASKMCNILKERQKFSKERGKQNSCTIPLERKKFHIRGDLKICNTPIERKKFYSRRKFATERLIISLNVKTILQERDLQKQENFIYRINTNL